jgi:hypothetical protein
MTDKPQQIEENFVARFDIRYVFRHKVSPLGRKHDIHQGWIPNVLDFMTLSFDQRGDIYIGNETRSTRYANLMSIESDTLTRHVIVTLGHTDGSEFDIHIEADSLDHVRKLRSPNYN